MKIVISQSMYFPWLGMFEQITLADKYVFYDDVQFSKGSFVNRVQIKTANGSYWLTVPVLHKLGQSIENTLIDNRQLWQNQHLAVLRQAYAKARYRDEMLDLVEDVLAKPYTTIAELSRASLMRVVEYFDLFQGREFIDVKDLSIAGSSSQRVLDIALALNADHYITGHGALRYLDHELFEQHDVSVCYLNYLKLPYTQLHGEFNSFVSVLDLIANCGPQGKKYMCSGTLNWKEINVK